MDNTLDWIFIVSQIVLWLFASVTLFKIFPKKLRWIGIFLILICFGFSMYYQFNKEEEKSTIQSQMVDAIIADKSDFSDIQELSSLKYKEIYKPISKDAKKFVNELLVSVDEKKSEMKSLSLKSNELADRLSLKWEPLYKYFLKQFDARAIELEKKGVVKENTKNNIKLIYVDDFMGIDESIRRLTFHSGNSIFVRIIPCKIAGGAILQYPQIILGEYIKNGQGSNYAYQIFFDETSFQIKEGYKKYSGLVERRVVKNNEDPLLDSSFLQGINEALNVVISTVYMSDFK